MQQAVFGDRVENVGLIGDDATEAGDTNLAQIRSSRDEKHLAGLKYVPECRTHLTIADLAPSIDGDTFGVDMPTRHVAFDTTGNGV